MVAGSAFGRPRDGVQFLRPLPDLPVDILESKLYTPTVRPGVVARPQLLARLHDSREVPTVAVVAPAGYGKTTLLALWAQADGRPFAWVSLDEHDNDPIVLLTHLAVALDRISPLPPNTFDALRSGGASVPATVVPRLGSALGRLPHPLVLVVDDVHHLDDGPSLDALVSLVGHVRGTTQITLAGRGMPVPLARERAQGRVVDIATDDLAFTVDGARTLLRAAGATLADDEVIALNRRTEGWAAGLYLAALARNASVPGREGRGGIADGLMDDYLDTELLSRLSSRELSFLTRTSVLDRLSGPLCDAVLQESGSAATLDHLQRANLFLVPLDGRRRWFRYHPVFRELLRTRLDADADPGLLRRLMHRAADWCETDGQLEAALHYAQEAGDVPRVAGLASALANSMYAAGRVGTLMEWLDWIAQAGPVERYPEVAALAAFVCALTGRAAAADRWADLAEHAAAGTGPPDGRDPTWPAIVRGLLCRDGVDRMRLTVEDADVTGRSPRDPQYVTGLFIGGVAHLLLGDEDGAEARFADAVELTDETRRPPIFSSIVGYQALLCLLRGDWAAAEACAARALSVVHRGHAESHLTSAVVFPVAARAALHRHDEPDARALLAEAQRLRPLLSHAVPWLAVESLLQMAEVSLGLGDPSGARLLLRDAEAVLRRRPDLGSLGKRTDELRARLGRLSAAAPNTSTLTSAELRVLPLLLTHLTLEGIATRLYLSRHTVKAQVESLYRKLDVHTRDDAVARARGLGLLTD